MFNLTPVYTHKVKDTGEIIKEMPYTGLRDIDAVQKLTGCAPHDLYSMGTETDNVSCMINVPANNEDGFNKLKIYPGCHVIVRENGTIEVWSTNDRTIQHSNLEVVSKDNIITL